MTALLFLIDDYLDTLALRDRSVHTIRAYRQTLRAFASFAGDTAPHEITHRVVARFLASVRNTGASSATVHKRYADLRSFFVWCLQEGEVNTNPMDRIERPRRTQAPVPLAEPDTIRALLALEWKTSFLTARNRAMILTCLDTGVRVSELCAMRLEDYDTAHNRVTVRGAKGSGTRVVPLGKAAVVAVRRYLRARARSTHADNPALWLGQRGDMSTSAIRMILRRACRDAGVAHVYPHQLRHTFAHHFRLNGGGDGDLMYLAGWSSPAMLRRYGASGAAVRAAQAHAKFSPADGLHK